jgi:protein tyrosine phosphatase
VNTEDTEACFDKVNKFSEALVSQCSNFVNSAELACQGASSLIVIKPETKSCTAVGRAMQNLAASAASYSAKAAANLLDSKSTTAGATTTVTTITAAVQGQQTGTGQQEGQGGEDQQGGTGGGQQEGGTGGQQAGQGEEQQQSEQQYGQQQEGGQENGGQQQEGGQQTGGQQQEGGQQYGGQQEGGQENGGQQQEGGQQTGGQQQEGGQQYGGQQQEGGQQYGGQQQEGGQEYGGQQQEGGQQQQYGQQQQQEGEQQYGQQQQEGEQQQQYSQQQQETGGEQEGTQQEGGYQQETGEQEQETGEQQQNRRSRDDQGFARAGGGGVQTSQTARARKTEGDAKPIVFERAVDLDQIECIDNQFFELGDDCEKTATALNIAYQYIVVGRDNVGYDWDECNDPTTATTTATSTATTLDVGGADVHCKATDNDLVVQCNVNSPRFLNQMLDTCNPGAAAGLSCDISGFTGDGVPIGVLKAGSGSRTCTDEIKLVNAMLADLTSRADSTFAPLKCLPSQDGLSGTVAHVDPSVGETICSGHVDELQKGIDLFKSGDYTNCKFSTATTTPTTSATSSATSSATTTATSTITSTSSTTTRSCFGVLDNTDCAKLTEADCDDTSKEFDVKVACPALCNECSSSTTTTTTAACNGVVDPTYCSTPEPDGYKGLCNKIKFGNIINNLCPGTCDSCPSTTATSTTTSISSTTTTFDEPSGAFTLPLYFDVAIGTDNVDPTRFSNALLLAMNAEPFNLLAPKQAVVGIIEAHVNKGSYTAILWLDSDKTRQFVEALLGEGPVDFEFDAMTFVSKDASVIVACVGFDDSQLIVVETPTCTTSVAEPLSLAAKSCMDTFPPVLECFKLGTGYILATKTAADCEALVPALSASMKLLAVDVAFSCSAGRFLTIASNKCAASARRSILAAAEQDLAGLEERNPACVVPEAPKDVVATFNFVRSTKIDEMVKMGYDAADLMAALSDELRRELAVGSAELSVTAFNGTTGTVDVLISAEVDGRRRRTADKTLELLERLIQSTSSPFVFRYDNDGIIVEMHVQAEGAKVQELQVKALASRDTQDGAGGSLAFLIVMTIILAIVAGGLFMQRQQRLHIPDQLAMYVAQHDISGLDHGASVVDGDAYSPERGSPTTLRSGYGSVSPPASPTSLVGNLSFLDQEQGSTFQRGGLNATMKGKAWEAGTVQMLGGLGRTESNINSAGESNFAATIAETSFNQVTPLPATMPAVNRGPADYSASESDILHKISTPVDQLQKLFSPDKVGKIKDEFDNVDSQSKLYPAMVAVKPENAGKSRTLGTAAFDVNRVQLITTHVGDPDYINASHVDGYFQPKDLILAQAPSKSTVRDFWHMIWDQQVTTVAMATATSEQQQSKSLQYWPSVVGGGLRYGSLTVMLRSMKKVQGSEHVIHRVLEIVTPEGNTRQISHFQLDNWPEGGVPANVAEFTTFMIAAREASRSKGFEAPLLIHGSRCAGRTGTCALFDIALHSAIDSGHVNLSKILHMLRRQRSNMVESPEQFTFVYYAIAKLFSQRGKAGASQQPPLAFCYEVLDRWELELNAARALPLDDVGDGDGENTDASSDEEVFDANAALDQRPSVPTANVYHPPPINPNGVVPDSVVNAVMNNIFAGGIQEHRTSLVLSDDGFEAGEYDLGNEEDNLVKAEGNRLTAIVPTLIGGHIQPTVAPTKIGSIDVLMPLGERIGALAAQVDASATSPTKVMDLDEHHAPRARKARASWAANEEEVLALSNDLRSKQIFQQQAERKGAALIAEQRKEADNLATQAREARAEREKLRLEMEEYKQLRSAETAEAKKKASNKGKWQSQFANRTAQFQ